MNDQLGILVASKLSIFSTGIGQALIQSQVYQRVHQLTIVKSIKGLNQALFPNNFQLIIADYHFEGYDMVQKLIPFPVTKLFITSQENDLRSNGSLCLSKNAAPSEALDTLLSVLQYADEERKDLPIPGQPPHDLNPCNLLTPREKDVLQLIYAPMNNKQIASTLFISPQTVNVHRKNIMKKLCVNSSVGLIKKAKELNYI